MVKTIPAGWQEKTLGEVCKKISAGGDKPEKFSQEITEIYNVPIYSNGIENDGLYGYTDVPAIIDEAITISARGTIGFVCKRGEPYYPIVRLISAIPNDYINIDFMAYALQFMVPTGNGSSIPQLTVPMLKNKIIKYPSLPEQERIVAKLDKAFEAIDKAKAIAENNLKNAKELFESSLNKAFTENTNDWEEKKLGEVCIIIAGQSPNSQFYNTEAKGLPFYQGKKEFTNKYIGAPSVWTTEITKEALSGDILMSVRAPVGPINYATEKCCIGRGLASIRNSKLLSKDFLFYYLLSIQQKIGGHDGAVFNSISRSEISAVKIQFPSIPDQQNIVARLDKLHEQTKQLEAVYSQKIKNLDELKQSILKRAFRGEL